MGAKSYTIRKRFWTPGRMGIVTVLAIIGILILGISTSMTEGTKSGLLQKVSKKPLGYHVMEVAYEGGRVQSVGENGAAYSNTQEFLIDDRCYDTLRQHKYVGAHITFDYESSIRLFKPSKKVTAITISHGQQ